MTEASKEMQEAHHIIIKKKGNNNTKSRFKNNIGAGAGYKKIRKNRGDRGDAPNVNGVRRMASKKINLFFEMDNEEEEEG